MKQKFTQARKANRCSAFSKRGNYDSPSITRQMKRESLQPKQSPIFGKQLKYIQVIDGKRIYHAYYRTAGYLL